jgi:hypothetical protein
MREIISRADLDLDDIHNSFFREHDKDRFLYLWAAFAKILSLPPGKLRPQDNIVDLLPQSKWSSVSVEIDNLTDLVLKEPKGREIHYDIKTLGVMMNFLMKSV